MAEGTDHENREDDEMGLERQRDSTYYDDSPIHGLCRRCGCCISFSILLLMLVGIGISLFIIIELHPMAPQIQLESTTIHNLAIQKQMQGPINFTSIVSGNITLIFSIVNPNKMILEYRPSRLSCMYKNVELGSTDIPFFRQASNSKDALVVNVFIDDFNMESSPSSALNNDVLHDNVTLDVVGSIRARIKVIGIHSHNVKVYLNCQLIIHPREMYIESKQCSL